jgi:Protein of unknown function (DUF2961)
MSCHRIARIVAVIFPLLLLISTIAPQKTSAQQPASRDIMERARRLHVDNLAFPKDYKTGKYTAYGNPRIGEQRKVVEIEGPGIITRIWTTQMHEDDVLNLYIYVDDSQEPVLAGPARELAAAAQLLSYPAIPWGGFLDGKSVSLYLPIPFQRKIRIDAEFTVELGDGPYWQVDYKKGVDPGAYAWKQQGGPGEIKIVPAGDKVNTPAAKKPICKSFTREVKAIFWPVDILFEGPAVIRGIHINSNYIDKLLLRISFDAEGGYSDPASRIDNVDFQVDTPLKYLVSNFNTAGVELHGTTASIYFPMPVKKEALIQLQIMMEEKEFHSKFPAAITIEYEESPPGLDRMLYFHAKASTEVSKGYQDFEVLSVRGKGHFVGVNLFDTNHDHGGGDNIFFDAGTGSAGQLHGICAEDYFHHAYMRIGVSAPYIHCPTHSARCRHHLEMPIPFQESFTFNWGSFDRVLPKAVAIWYQKDLSMPERDDLTYNVTGQFPMRMFEELAPGKPLPETVVLNFKEKVFPRKTWQHIAQNGFVDLCHASRQYSKSIPPCSGGLEGSNCYVAETKIWAAKEAETKFMIGCDDRIRVYLGDELIGESAGNKRPDPFESFSATASLKAGVNTIRVVAANTVNYNWLWHGFSLVLKNNLTDGQMLYMY